MIQQTVRPTKHCACHQRGVFLIPKFAVTSMPEDIKTVIRSRPDYPKWKTGRGLWFLSNFIISQTVRRFLILATKKCRIYAACGVSQTPNSRDCEKGENPIINL